MTVARAGGTPGNRLSHAAGHYSTGRPAPRWANWPPPHRSLPREGKGGAGPPSINFVRPRGDAAEEKSHCGSERERTQDVKVRLSCKAQPAGADLPPAPRGRRLAPRRVFLERCPPARPAVVSSGRGRAKGPRGTQPR